MRIAPGIFTGKIEINDHTVDTISKNNANKVLGTWIIKGQPGPYNSVKDLQVSNMNCKCLWAARRKST